MTAVTQLSRPAVRRPLRLETADGARLHHIDWGEGRPVLFVHAWALSSEMWKSQMVHLADRGFRCIAFDCRGHGRSDDPGRGYDIDTLAGDIGAVIEQLDLSEDLALVGYSMGAATAIRYLGANAGVAIGRLALISGAAPCLTRSDDNPYGAEAALFDAVRAQMAADFPAWIEAGKRPFFTPDTSEATMDWLAELMRHTSLKAVLDCNRALVAADVRPDLARIDIPTLIVHGNADVSAPIAITGDRLAAGLPHADYKVYDGAPHGLFATHQDRLNADLAVFLGGLSR
jgi:non-heme chloroperoxidase